MLKDTPRLDGHGPDRELVLRLRVAGSTVGEEEAARRMAAAVEERGVSPALLEQLQRSLLEALRKPAPPDVGGEPSPEVQVSLWISTRSRGIAGSGAAPDGGWGFFLLERQEEPSQDQGVAPRRNIEICLY